MSTCFGCVNKPVIFPIHLQASCHVKGRLPTRVGLNTIEDAAGTCDLYSAFIYGKTYDLAIQYTHHYNAIHLFFLELAARGRKI